jgi:hypothetical protein
MAYRELTCEDPMDLDTLYRGSLRVMPDGSYAQQVVYVSVDPCPNPETLDVLVSSAGTADVNGTYVASGTTNGKVSYTKDGGTERIFYLTDFGWLITDSFSNPYYYATSSADYPFGLTWELEFLGAEPIPEVTCS